MHDEPTSDDRQGEETGEVSEESIIVATIAPDPPTLPRVWTPFAALGLSIFAVVAGQAVVGAAFAFYLLSQGSDVQQLSKELMDRLSDPPMFIAMAFIPQLLFGGIAIAGAWLSKSEFRQRLGLLRPRMNVWLYPAILLSCIVPTAIGIGFAQLVALVIPGDPSVQQLYEKMTLPMAIPFVLFIALAPGFCEELLFRGYCQRRWLERWSPWTAITATSCLFALFHMMPHAVVFAFPIGMWLGYIAWKTDSVWPSIWCHAFVNGTWNILQISFMMNDVDERVQIWIYASLVILGLVCFFVTLAGLRHPPERSTGVDN